jgi:hypothetical protein
MNRQWSILILITVCLISLVISLGPILAGIFPFTFDQARDLLWVKNQVDFNQPSLVGPWGSLTGTFFGPLWFWLLTIPYALFNGSPVAVTLFNSLVVFGSLILAAVLLYKKDKSVAYFLILLGFLSAGFHNIANYAFSQHLLLPLTFLLIYSYTQILLKSDSRHFILSFLWLGLMFHAEPPISIFSLPSFLLISWLAPQKSKLLKPKTILTGLAVFILTFLPLIIFDLRHQFLQLNSILAYLQGQNQSLGDILPFWQRLFDRPLKLFAIYQVTVFQTSSLAALAILGFTAYLNQRKNEIKFFRKLWQASLVYLFSLWLLFVIFPPQFKLFYLDGLKIIFVIWTAMILASLWRRKTLRKFVVAYLLLVFVVNLNPLFQIKSFKNHFNDRRQSHSVFINQQQAIDWIYQNAQGSGFKLYSYVPPVYDYTYQYLIFWHGLKRYRYLPEEFAYLPDQPDYVPKKPAQLARLQDKIKLANDLVYLIIEPDDYSNRRQDWLAQFPQDKYQLLEEYTLPDQTTVEKRQIL